MDETSGVQGKLKNLQGLKMSIKSIQKITKISVFKAFTKQHLHESHKLMSNIPQTVLFNCSQRYLLDVDT